MDFPKYAKIGQHYYQYIPELKRYCTNGGAWTADESLVKSRIFKEVNFIEWAKDQRPHWFDWKWISQQKGYKSIKETYIRNLNYRHASKRDKDEAVELMKKNNFYGHPLCLPLRKTNTLSIGSVGGGA